MGATYSEDSEAFRLVNNISMEFLTNMVSLQSDLLGRLKSRPGLRLLLRCFNVSVGKVIGTITHFSTIQPVVALTFDDGPHPVDTPLLLDLLERYQAKVTFFMIGKSAEKYPQIVSRTVAAGHAIGNHSWDHPSFSLISGRERRTQIRACATAIAPHGLPLFRPPYAHQNIISRLEAWQLGHEVIGWNLAAADWRGYSATQIYNRLKNGLHPGSIVLLHDTLNTASEIQYASREPMLEAVDRLLDQFKDRFHFVTIPDMFQYGDAERRLWFRKANSNSLNRLIKVGK